MEHMFQFTMNRNPENGNDSEMVYYCLSCHSLYILTDESLAFGGWDGSFCGKCGDTHLGKCTIEEWLEEEKKRADKRREIEWSK